MADQVPTSDLAVMESFLAQYGGAPEASPGDGGRAEKPAIPSESPPVNEGDEDSGLDPATLEALGLVPAGTPSPQDGDEDGAPQPQVDLDLFAKALGLSADDLSFDGTAVRLKTKVDGEQAAVSLDEMRKGYQLQKHFTRQQEQFLAERRQWEQAVADREAQLRAQADMATEVLASEEQALKQAYTLDWDSLRVEDPGEYAAKVAEYNQKLAGIRARQSDLVARFQERQRHQQMEHAQKMQATMQQEQEFLRQALKWDDQDKAVQGAKAIFEYLSNSVGLPAEQINTITDHRAFVVADKARRYDELMAKVEIARKKVSDPSPKIPSGNAPIPRGQTARRQTQAAMSRLRSDHSVESAAEVFKHLKVV